MPDEIEFTLKDVWKELVQIKLSLTDIEIKLNGLTAGNIINGETDDDSPFFNPDTKLYDMKYYRENFTEKDK